MKALVYTGSKALEMRDMPDPVAAEGAVIVEVHAVGICGSDMHAYLGHDARRPAPLILGHEAAGVIVDGPETGRRVTVNPLVGCGTCAACLRGADNLCPDRQIISMPPREGGFAERVAIPAANCVTVPDHVGFAQAALAEPLACGWHAVRLALTGRTGVAQALVLGGGAIGVGAALALQAQGVADVKVVEPNALRHAAILAAGPIKVVTEAQGSFAVIIDAVGIAATRAAASALAEPGGVIAHIGLGSSEGGLDIRRMTLQEITFIGTYTYTPQDFRDTAAAIFDGRLGPLGWVEERALADGAQAFADILAGQVAAPKVILTP